MDRLKLRLTDPEVAENLRSNAEGLEKVGIKPPISVLQYIKLSAYEDKEADQTFCSGCQQKKVKQK